MDNELTEERESMTTARDEARTGRCGWIGLGLVLLLVPGIFPGGFIACLACLKNFEELVGHRLGNSLSGRIIVVAGMAGGLVLASAVLIVVTLAVRRVAQRIRWIRSSVNEPSA